VKMIGFASVIAKCVEAAPRLALPLVTGMPFCFAFVAGSGMAATQSLYGLLLDPASIAEIDPLQTGALVSIGAAAGRTMSPVSPVTLMGAKLTDVSPLTIVSRVALPLLAGLFVTVLMAMLM
jgi:C4-dicarboxylate transporter, DcuC family